MQTDDGLKRQNSSELFGKVFDYDTKYGAFPWSSNQHFLWRVDLEFGVDEHSSKETVGPSDLQVVWKREPKHSVSAIA